MEKIWEKAGEEWQLQVGSNLAIISKKGSKYWAKCYLIQDGNKYYKFTFPPKKNLDGIKNLVETNYCFCTKAELKEKRKEQYELDREVALLGADEVEVFDERRWYDTYD